MYRHDGVYTPPFAYGDVPDPLKMYRGMECVEKFEEYIKKEVKQLYATFPQQSMTELTDVWRENTRQQKGVTSASKSSMTHRTKR